MIKKKKNGDVYPLAGEELSLAEVVWLLAPGESVLR